MRTQHIIPSVAVVFGCATTHAQWAAVGDGLNGYANASAVYNGAVHVGGTFNSAGGVTCLGVARWNGTAWGPVGGGTQQAANTHPVQALTVFDNELIAGGWLDSVSGIPVHNVARWNGTTWSPMDADMSIDLVSGFTVHNGELYACGVTDGTGMGTGHCVMRWSGSNWVAIGSSTFPTVVYALASYGGSLYAAGSFEVINGVSVNGIARWDGTTWSDLEGGIPWMGFQHSMRALAVFDGKLFVGGHFSSVSNVVVNNIASWDGNTWADVGGGIDGGSGMVYCLAAGTDELFVGGDFLYVDGLGGRDAAMWDGSTLTALGGDLGAGSRSMSLFNNTLYSFGERDLFDQNHAAYWSGGNFTSVAQQAGLGALHVVPNPVERGGSIVLHPAAGYAGDVATMRIVDADGRSVYSHQFPVSSGLQRVRIPEALTPGCYVIELRDQLFSAKARGRLIIVHSR